MVTSENLDFIKAMAMLRKALVASFIATPNKSGCVEMKSTENRRLSLENLKNQTKPEEDEDSSSSVTKKVECLVLNDPADECSATPAQEEVSFRDLEVQFYLLL